MRKHRWLIAGLTLMLGCAPTPFDLQLTDHETPSRHTVFRLDWRTSVAPPTVSDPPINLQQSRWAPLELSTPVVVARKTGDRSEVVVGGSNGVLKAFTARGKLIWAFAGHGPMSSPGAADGRIFVGTGEGHLYAIGAEDGTLIWEYEAGEELGSLPVIKDGIVYLTSHSDTLLALDAATGKWLWHYRRDASSHEFSVRGVNTPLLVKDLVVCGFSDGSTVALHQKDGAVVWQHVTSGNGQIQDADGSAQSDGERVFVANYKDGLSALALGDGRILWQHAFPTATQLQLGRGALFASAVGKVAAFSPYDGSLLWEKGIGTASATGLATFPGLLMVATDGPLFFLDARAGRPLGSSFNPGRGISAAPLAVGRDLYVLSNDGWLYAMHLL